MGFFLANFTLKIGYLMAVGGGGGGRRSDGQRRFMRRVHIKWLQQKQQPLPRHFSLSTFLTAARFGGTGMDPMDGGSSGGMKSE